VGGEERTFHGVSNTGVFQAGGVLQKGGDNRILRGKKVNKNLIFCSTQGRGKIKC